MSKYLFSLLIFSFYTLANSQITTELISDKKDDILLKSNESISFFINHVDSDILKLANDFEAKEVRLMINGGNRVAYLFWKAKADSIREVTSLVIHDLLEEMNKIAQLADDTDKDYVWRDGYTRRAQELKPLFMIEHLNKRVIPLQRVFGEDGLNPKPEGIHIEERILSYKNDVLKILGNYSFDGDISTFPPFESEELFKQSIKNVHPVDTTSLTYINNIILLESKKYLKELGSDEYITITWMTDNFYYSSVLETAVILNQLILKIKLIEKESLALLLSKIPSGY